MKQSTKAKGFQSINRKLQRVVEPSWHVTVSIAAGVGFENRLPVGNAEKKYDYEINEKFLRKSQAPNRS
jgi:hypothetical protein